MIDRRYFLAALAGLTLAGQASAGATQLSAAEISALLTGKRITGDWNGTSYGQSFGASGITVYSPEGGLSETGRWRVNSDANTYESWWERSGWSAYAIERENGALSWVDGRGKRYPFEVLED